MANLILTNFCNANCEFCFAADFRRRTAKKWMSDREYFSWLWFLQKAGITEIRLLGGEPTLHPLFADLVKKSRTLGMSILVFTNGMVGNEELDVLSSLEPEVCKVVVNINAARFDDEHEQVLTTLKRLGNRVVPGITLTSPNFSLEEPVSAIETYGLCRSIRLGISHPTWLGNNRSLHPKRYTAVGQTLYEQSFMTAERGIKLEADCGFVRCMFGHHFDEMVSNGFHYNSKCTPVLDLCCDGVILPCFALSNLVSVKGGDFSDAQEVYRQMTELLKPWHTFGIYPECAACPYFETEECCGGCLAARLRRLMPIRNEI